MDRALLVWRIRAALPIIVLDGNGGGFGRKMMIRFGSKVKSKRIFLFITAMDKTVIARPNFRVFPGCWEKLPPFENHTLLQPKSLVSSPVYEHVRMVLESEKYRFLWRSREEFDHTLEHILSLQLPEVLWQEIAWLQRYGYFYHHSLAVLVMLTRFGLDSYVDQFALELAQKAALLCDVGISRLPSTLLFSSHLFTEDERLAMMQHPMVSYLLIGYYLQERGRELGTVVLHHHSPDQFTELDPIREANIRDAAWMIYNFDIFDALISNRPFRPAYQPENAVIYLKQVNRGFALPMDIVYWLEERFGMRSPTKESPSLIPIHPKIQNLPLN